MARSEELQDLVEDLTTEAGRDRPAEETPEIGIVMGSDSDLDAMAGASEALTDLGFEEVTDSENPPDSRYSFESYVVSAHRTPDLMYVYGDTAADRGLDVLVAGAGGKSADLPNMIASLAFPLPTIGIPVQEKSVDSVIGMPTGAPIVAVDAGKSHNAALSAVQILAREHDELADRLQNYHEDLEDDVARVSRALHEQGTPAYRDAMEE
ncbi:5-(carboxyamino)imidazole ribonucleotide mutase [Halobacteriales archaeon QS_3_64_16]|nr:MAG: 5-(carboxyamino)imidazole ribonucleotide mutase [Halobacteriales archaeon QS_3_64_16]